MDIGFGAPVSGAWATPQNLAAFAAGAERDGYRSLWSFQRLLVPAGSGMDPVYQSVLDPMAALSFAAAVTSVIRLGVAIVNAPFVSPGYLAKQAASVDVLSGGRHDLGIGIGWMPEEFALTGADMARRGARLSEYVQVLRTLWAGGDRSFDGSFYRVPAGTQAPPPVQAGGPPVLLGGLARPALERVGRIADGWITSSRTDLSKIDQLIEIVKESAAAAGRDAEALRIICRGVVRAGAPVAGPDGQRLLLSGSYEQIRADTERLGTLGVTEVFYDLNWDPEIGSPDVDPAAATERAEQIMQALAPAAA
ncbi:MAG TPA: TIGR03619 family F420-dependent LLM class oxidoreductase [Streptosporangiaceae bacterium]|nr:TIGR03619 family F420-dependent LLM class oxidoreductase [Streptosporangiaceae bacterium]